jgi:hypothetical protein
MAFGQPTGPPASAKQVGELLELLQSAGHVDFRDARGPMGFTQRQAGGRFTRDEASTLIEQLHEAELEGTVPVVAERPERLSAAEQAIRRLPVEQLVTELERRGWTVTAP